MFGAFGSVGAIFDFVGPEDTFSEAEASDDARLPPVDTSFTSGPDAELCGMIPKFSIFAANRYIDAKTMIDIMIFHTVSVIFPLHFNN